MALPFHKLLASLGGGTSVAARNILAAYGTDAHIYLPGIGALNGYTLGNYLESTGNTDATVDNPVGLVLDAGTAVGAEIHTDPLFADGVVWKLWQPTAGSTTITGGLMRVNSTDGSYAAAEQLAVPTITAGKTYEFTVVITAVNAGSATVSVGLTAGAVMAAPGTYTGRIVASSTVKPELKRSAGVTDFTASMFSIKEVPGIHALQGTTANKPILRKPSNNYYWEFDGVNDNLAATSAPFQMADDHCVILGVSRAAVTAEKHPVGVGSSSSTTPIAAFIVHWGSGYISVYWRDDASTLYIAQSGATYSAGQVRVVSARKSGNNKVCRVDGVGGSVNSTPVGATSAFDKLMIGATHTGSFGGNIYPVIAIKGDISDANLLILERWVGSLTGPTGVVIP